MEILTTEIRNLIEIDLNDSKIARLIGKGSIANSYELKNLSKPVCVKLIPNLKLN